MRILQFISQYPYPTQFDSDLQTDYVCSGAERVAYHLSCELVDLGNDVTVVTSSKDKQRSSTKEAGVDVVRYPTLTRVGNTQVAPRMLTFSTSKAVDVVHVHNGTPPGAVAGVLFAKRHDLPLIITHHGGENYSAEGSIIRRLGSWAYIRFLTRGVLNSADTVVVPSKGFVDESLFLDCSMDSVRAIPNAVTYQKFQLPSKTDARSDLGFEDDEFVILFMGTHNKLKGPDILLDAFTPLARENVDAKLILAGSGPLTPALKKRARSNGIFEQVMFPGFVPEEDKPKYLRAADTFAFPSPYPRSENFPLVLLEAAAADTSIIATDFPSLRSFLADSGCSRLVTPGDKQSMSEALWDLYSNEELVRQYCENSINLARRNSWQDIAAMYLSLYREHQ